MNTIVSKLIQLNNVKSIKPVFCDDQAKDIQRIFELADDMASSAVAMSNQGNQGYQSFIDARESFRNYVISSSRKYRIVEVEVE